MQNKKFFYSTLFANFLSHYDASLYVMLAPFLAKVFFIDNTVASLLKIYSVPIITIFMAPIGAIIFGKLILIWGPARTLISSLTGVSICTMIMGILPTYEQVGVWAPLLLIILRAIQAIFSAGESEVSSLFVIEKAMRKSFVSSLYSCSSILGFTCASCVAYLVSKTSDPLSYWRYAFIGGLFTGLANLWLRYISNKNLELLETKSPPKINWTKAYPIILKVILINGSNFLNFVVAFVGMNVLIPLFTKHTTADMLWLNNILLVFDILLLPFFGWLGDRFGALNIMLISSLTMTITIIPLFYVLPFSTLGQIAIIRMIVIIPGLAFAAQTRVWFYGLCNNNNRYLITGFASIVGASLFNKTAVPIFIKLWDSYNVSIAPAIYVSMVSLTAFIVLYYDKSTKSFKD